MPFKMKEWKLFVLRLEEAGKRQQALDSAVWSAWSFAEYAINVLLELDEKGPEQGHRQVLKAQELRLAGLLQESYEKVLEDLRQYRLRAGYGSYSSHPSVHYSPANVQECLEAMARLQAEVVRELKSRRRWSE